MIETHPIPPFVPPNSKVLILGSFPGGSKSLVSDWYYGTKRTQFWKILEGVYNLSLVEKEGKIALLKKLKVAITDTIYQCERAKGTNLDNNLINVVYNFKAIGKILKENKIQRILFSSRFAESNYRKHFRDLINKYPNIELITLPSPSPRYAKLRLEEKIKIYKKLLPGLLQ